MKKAGKLTLISMLLMFSSAVIIIFSVLSGFRSNKLYVASAKYPYNTTVECSIYWLNDGPKKSEDLNDNRSDKQFTKFVLAVFVVTSAITPFLILLFCECKKDYKGLINEITTENRCKCVNIIICEIFVFILGLIIFIIGALYMAGNGIFQCITSDINIETNYYKILYVPHTNKASALSYVFFTVGLVLVLQSCFVMFTHEGECKSGWYKLCCQPPQRKSKRRWIQCQNCNGNKEFTRENPEDPCAYCDGTGNNNIRCDNNCDNGTLHKEKSVIKVCPWCQGSTQLSRPNMSRSVPCNHPKCNAKGFWTELVPDPKRCAICRGNGILTVKCTNCNGRKYETMLTDKCNTCYGSGGWYTSHSYYDMSEAGCLYKICCRSKMNKFRNDNRRVMDYGSLND